MEDRNTQAHQILDLTENISNLLYGYNVKVGLFSLINCIALVCLNDSKYQEGCKVVVPNMLSEAFSDEGLESTLELKNILFHRYLKIKKNYKSNKH